MSLWCGGGQTGAPQKGSSSKRTPVSTRDFLSVMKKAVGAWSHRVCFWVTVLVRVAITKCHRLGGRTTETCFSQFWRLETHRQGADRAGFF